MSLTMSTSVAVSQMKEMPRLLFDRGILNVK